MIGIKGIFSASSSESTIFLTFGVLGPFIVSILL
jgi:hypothetical protein